MIFDAVSHCRSDLQKPRQKWPTRPDGRDEPRLPAQLQARPNDNGTAASSGRLIAAMTS